MSDLRERMVDALADFLDIDRELASRAMHATWELTKDVRAGNGPPTWQPDLTQPGQALARRVQAALEREFHGEELFPAVVVVQDPRTWDIGLAATLVDFGEAVHLLQLGQGAARRAVRQFGPRP